MYVKKILIDLCIFNMYSNFIFQTKTQLYRLKQSTTHEFFLSFIWKIFCMFWVYEREYWKNFNLSREYILLYPRERLISDSGFSHPFEELCTDFRADGSNKFQKTFCLILVHGTDVWKHQCDNLKIYFMWDYLL